MVTKDLGLVTAYAYAVAGGYTGTEEEFQALLGNIAIDLAEIENLSVTVTTLPAGSSATASYDSGVLSLGIPKGDKGDPGDVANVAPEFSTSTPYGVGEYVIYNDLLYKFKEAKAAGAWDSTKVEAKTVGTELTDLKEDINDIRDVVVLDGNLVDDSVYEVGAIQSDGSVATNGVWGDQRCGVLFPVEGGKTYYYAQFINDVPNVLRRNYLFYDSSKAPISGSYASVTENYTTITAPSNAVYARVSWYNTSRPVFSTIYPRKYIPYEIVVVNKMEFDINGDINPLDDILSNYVTCGLHESKNLINPSEVQKNKLMASDGTLVDSTTYDTTGYIPVSAGEDVAISPKCRLYGLFDKSMVLTAYNNDDLVTPRIVTPSVDGYIRLSLYKDGSPYQVEYGSTPTSYEPFDGHQYFEENVHLSDTMKSDVKELVGGNTMQIVKEGNNLLVVADIEENTLSKNYSLNGFNSRNKTFNFSRVSLGNVVIKECSDDITPQRLGYLENGEESQWTVGANHGWMCYRTAKGSLSQDDTGSIWSDGTTQYTLIVVDAYYAYFAFPCEKVGEKIRVDFTNPTADLQHVSGATHTSTVSITGGGMDQFYPSVNHKSIKIYNGDTEITEDGLYHASVIRVVEHYEIMDCVDIVSTVRDNIGVSLESLADGISSVLALDYVYEITPQTEVVYSTATAITDTILRDSGFMQAAGLIASGGTVYRYINGVKDGTVFASSSLHDMSNYDTTNDIYKADLIDASKPSNRTVDLCIDSSDNVLYGFTIGFIPDVGDGSDAERSKLPSYIWDMRSTKKIYPACCVNKELASGECVNVVGYRHYIMPNSPITNRTVIPVGNKKYIFLDAHGETSGNVKIDGYGEDVTVIDSSDMVLSDVVCANGVTYSSAESYSTAQAKVK